MSPAWAADYYRDPADTIRLTPQSATFGIELPAAPTDGQVWTIQSIDRNLIRLVNARFESASQHQIWLFQVREPAVAQGFQTDIAFIYRRLASGAPAQTAAFRVVNYAPQ